MWHHPRIASNEPRAGWTLAIRAGSEQNITKEINPMSTAKTSVESGQTGTAATVKYTGKAHTTGGRDGGSTRSSDGRLDVKLTFPGTPGNGTNPEQLLAAGWSACFLTNIKIAASKSKVRVTPESSVDGEVDLCADGDGFCLRARLDVSLPGLDRDVAQSLVDAAHQACPYSKATRGNVDVTINLIG
jgi:osmotically inducible protein OsmC